MSSNPFRKSPKPLKRRDDWIGREDAVKKLQDCIINEENTVIMGVEGSGKSSLIKSFFNFDYRLRMAREENKLFCFADMTTVVDSTEFCSYLYNQIRSEISVLLAGDPTLPQILKEMDEQWNETIPRPTKLLPKESFQEAMKKLFQRNYYVVLLMDAFERFTTSQAVTQEHHDMLRSPIEQDLMMCIVATNFDLDKNSLPPDVTGSLYLQKFTNKILVKPFTETDAKVFISKKLAGNEIQISESLVEQLYSLTGGIPGLFEMACSCAYDHLEENGGIVVSAKLRQEIYQTAIPRLECWCGMFEPNHIKAINQILDNQRLSGKKKQMGWCVRSTGNAMLSQGIMVLKQRGLLVPFTVQNAEGKTEILSDYYQLNCRLLQMYLQEYPCRENPLLAMKREIANKMRQELERQDNQKRMDDLARQKAEAELDQIRKNVPVGPGTTITIQGNYYAGDYNQTVHMSVISADQFLREIGIGAILDQNRLRERAVLAMNDIKALPVLHVPNDIVDADGEDSPEKLSYEHELDQTIAKAAMHILPDVDPQSLETTNLDTLDQRFYAIRSAMGLEEGLSDQVMGALSPLCAFYLKSALVVDDHLSSITGLLDNDHSTHLVMYGKCLEQCLRDTLYPLFHSHPIFKDYNTWKGCNTPGHPDTFGGMSKAADAMLGAFYYMLKCSRNDLAELCIKNGIVASGFAKQPSNNSEWKTWWKNFQTRVGKAKNIRNYVHAGAYKPSSVDVMKIRQYVCDPEGILRMSLVVSTLNENLGSLIL